MTMPASYGTYPTPISLTDLVAASGALAIDPKPNQVWRCVLDEQIIIGYKTTAVVAGRDELAMAYVSARLHHVANEDADPAQYRTYAMAMDIRKVFVKASRTDMQTLLLRVVDLAARLANMDEVQFSAVMQLLADYAPDEQRAAVLALACYERGVQDGLDAAAPAFDEDDLYLPDMPDVAPHAIIDMPGPPLAQSA